MAKWEVVVIVVTGYKSKSCSKYISGERLDGWEGWDVIDGCGFDDSFEDEEVDVVDDDEDVDVDVDVDDKDDDAVPWSKQTRRVINK